MFGTGILYRIRSHLSSQPCLDSAYTNEIYCIIFQSAEGIVQVLLCQFLPLACIQSVASTSKQPAALQTTAYAYSIVSRQYATCFLGVGK